jgi:hypothetical protein
MVVRPLEPTALSCWGCARATTLRWLPTHEVAAKSQACLLQHLPGATDEHTSCMRSRPE